MIRVFTRPDCQPCNATKRQMDRHGIKFVEIAISDDNRQSLQALGHMQAPVIVTPSGDSWSGFQPDKIMELKKL